MPPRGNVRVVVTGDARPLDQELSRSEGRLKRYGGAFTTSAKAMLGLGAAAGVVGGAIFEIGAQFDDATDSIRVGTGRTGRALKGLQRDFRSVVRTVPTDFESASTAVASLNRRLGLTGRPLRQVSRQILELTRLTNTDLGTNIQSLTRLFGDFGVAASRQPQALNAMYRASQATGVEVSRLADLMVRFGSPLRQLGFGFEDTAAMMGKFEKEGVNTNLVMGSMRLALRRFSEAGRDPASALRETIAEIRSAGSTARANQKAFEVFGARAGADVAAAIREGRFEFGNLERRIASGRDTITRASRDTQDFAEKWQMFKNRVLVGIEPMATRFFNLVGDGMDRLGQVNVRHVISEIQGVANAAGAYASMLAPVALGVGSVVMKLGGLGLAFAQTRGAMVLLGAATGALLGRMLALGAAWVASRVLTFVTALRSLVTTIGVLRAVYIAQTGATNASTFAVLRYIAATRLATGASRALAGAMASTGFGALLVIVGSVAGALLGMKATTDRARFSADELNASLRRQVEAMRAIRDIDLDVAQRKANLRSASVGVEQAQARVNQLVDQGKKGTTEYRAALADLEQAKIQQRRAARDLNRAEEDAKNTRRESARTIRTERDEIGKNIGALRAEVRAAQAAVDANKRRAALAARGSPVPGRGPGRDFERAAEYTRRADEAAERLARTQLRLERVTKQVNDENIKLKRAQIGAAEASGASKTRVEGLRNELSRLRDRSDRSADRIRRLRREIGELQGKRVRVDVDLNLIVPGAADAAGDLRGDGWGLARAVRRGAQAKAKANPEAFMAAMGGLGNGEAGAVDAFNPFARRFGLGVSSGYRAGSITSSGNLSYHALNRARDYAGPAGGMMAFARFMASRYGARLKELIYTPLGFSIKNGQRVAPYAAADHYDHVHVAMRRGGVVPSMLSPGEVGVLPNGRTFTVPGRPVAADTVPMNLPVGTAVLTGDGQRRMLAGAPLGEALRRQAPHFRKGGWVRTGATIDPTRGQWPRYDDRGGMSFAELLVAGANRGLRPDITQLLGFSRGDYGAAMGTEILIRAVGSRRAFKIVKNDNGSGQKGDPHYTTDLHSAAARAVGLPGKGDIEIARVGTSPAADVASARGKGRSFTRITAPKVTHPLLGDMLDPLVDDALMGGIESGVTGAGRRPLLRQVLEGIVPESDDRATREKVSIPAGQVGKRIERMIARGDSISAKKLAYQYGGYGNPSYDCSGFVSTILNAGGLLKGRLDTTKFKTWGEAGRGRLVTLGIKGGSGRSGHMMMKVGDRYYESNPSGGVGRRSGWSSSFDTWRRPSWRAGGVVGPGGQRMLPPSAEGRAHLEKLAVQRGVSIDTLLDPRSREWVGNGLRRGGVAFRFQDGIEPEAWGEVVGRTKVVRGPQRNRRPRLTLRDLVHLLGGSPGTERADRLTRRLGRDVQGADFGALLARQRQARRQIRRMAEDGFTGEERIKTRRLRGAISLLQDEAGRRIGRPLGTSDRAQERISRAQARFDDELIVDGVEPDSAEGRERLDDARASQIRTLRRRRRGLRRALRLARRTRNRAAIDRVTGEIDEVNDQVLGLRSNRKQAKPTARDRATAALAQAELSGDRGGQVAALRSLEDLARKQYEQAMKSGDAKDIATAASELRSATEALRSAMPTDRDFADMNLALAELTAGEGDNIAALTTLQTLAQQQLEQARASGDPREIAEAARNLKSAADALKAAVPTAEDFASRDLAMAKLTEGLGDDLAAQQRLLAIAEGRLAEALLTDDPRDDTEAANNLASARDAVRALTEEMTRSNELAQQRLELDRQRVDLDRRFLAYTETQGPLIVASLIELMNDGVGGRAKLASRTPAVAGAPASYR